MTTISTALDLALAGHTVEQTQSLLARLDFFDESIILTRFNGGRAQYCHEVDPTDLAGAVAGVPLVTGHLPRNCLFYERQAGVETIAILLPAKQRTLTTRIGNDFKRYRLSCPDLVWYGKGNQYYVFAVYTSDGWPRADAQLWLPPFPNLGNEGRMCAGNVAFPICNASSIHVAAELFFESEFNNHSTNNRSRKWNEDLLVGWAERESQINPWPIDDLFQVTSLEKLREGKHV